MKHPVVCSQIKIRSETANKSYNDLFHTFTLPVAGDYVHNFVLKSDYIIKGYQNQILAVDCIGNYIDNVILSLNNRSTILSHIDNIQKIDSLLSPYVVNDKPIVKLDFLSLPLLVKCASETNFLITIKFKQNPPIDYYLAYDAMFTDDASYSDRLQNEYFTVTCVSQQSLKTSKSIQLTYDHSRVYTY